MQQIYETETKVFFLEAFCDISHRLGGITPFGVFFDAFPGLKMWVTLACTTVKILNPFYNLNCCARERAPWPRVTEKSHFSTPNVGLAGTGNQTQATMF
jgi:hypothetical protein